MDKNSRKNSNSRQKPEKSALLGFQGAVKASKHSAWCKYFSFPHLECWNVKSGETQVKPRTPTPPRIVLTLVEQNYGKSCDNIGNN